MLKVLETLDIATVERVRESALGCGLDAHDSFSWHALLTEGGEPLGEGRFYREGQALVIDRIALLKPCTAHRELLFRALLLKASVQNPERIFVIPQFEQAYYRQFGLAPEGDRLSVLPSAVRFPSECGCGK